jgi:hypothetical protein
MRKSVNSYSDRENQDKGDHLEKREAANDAIVYYGKNECDHKQSTIQCVSHHRRKGEEF